MSHISKSVIVPYTVEEMFTLVDDFESYPLFIPWCIAANVISRDEHEVKATLTFSRGGLQKSFTTSNRNQTNKMIDIRLVSGPFKRLQGYWRFDPIADVACRVSLDMEFEFAGRLISFAFGPLFQQIASTLVDAFQKRAVEIYGQREIPD